MTKELAQVGAGPFRMFKGFLAEGGIRTPLIISGSDVTGSGRISDAVVHLKDIPATILDAAGVSHPTTFEGKTVAPLQGKALTPILGSKSSRSAARTNNVILPEVSRLCGKNYAV